MTDESGWQPIETAPRDGNIVLLADHRQVVAGFWVGPERDEQFPWHFLDDTFAACGLNGWTDNSAGPTHWMPLPAPPEPSS